jgi:hypothetical protein
MATYFVGLGGDDTALGTSWATRLLTLNAAEDSHGGGNAKSAIAAGDKVYVAPGVYRETLTLDVSGASTYSTGTCDVVNGSTTVTGHGTSWSANAAIDYIFHITVLAHGTDGVTVNGGAHFTSAAGNFQAGHVGMTIRINTVEGYIIASVVSATEITVTDTAGVAPTFSAATGLTYDVGPEEPYDISSVTDNTHLELKDPWNGPSLTGLIYLIYNTIRYIGDVTGEHTDGVGGIVRITGSDNDTTATRADCIHNNTPRNYRLFQGFMMDTTTGSQYSTGNGSIEIITQDCVFLPGGDANIKINGTTNILSNTIRRCFILASRNSQAIFFSYGASIVNNSANLIQDCIIISGSAITNIRIGGILIRNCTFPFEGASGSGVGAVSSNTAALGAQVITVNNCIFQSCNNAVNGYAAGDILEDYNSFYANTADRINTTIGAHSNAYPALLLLPMLMPGIQYPLQFGALSQWSQLTRIAGFNPSPKDLFGMVRPVTNAKKSWGAIQFADVSRSTTQKHGGSYSLKFADAGRAQFTVPTSNTGTIFSVYVYREADYAGVNPQMIIKQPGVADNVVLDGGAASGWNLLTVTMTPAAVPTYVIIELVSNNTAVAGSYNVYFDDIVVT